MAQKRPSGRSANPNRKLGFRELGLFKVEANSPGTGTPVRRGVKPKPAHKPSKLSVAGIPGAAVVDANVVGGENAGGRVLGTVHAVANSAVGAVHNNKGPNNTRGKRTPKPKRAKTGLKSVPDPFSVAETVAEVLVVGAGGIVQGAVLRKRILRVFELNDPYGAVPVNANPVNRSLDPKPRLKHRGLAAHNRNAAAPENGGNNPGKRARNASLGVPAECSVEPPSKNKPALLSLLFGTVHLNGSTVPHTAHEHGSKVGRKSRKPRRAPRQLREHTLKLRNSKPHVNTQNLNLVYRLL